MILTVQQKIYDSKDYGPRSIKAADIPESGMEFVFEGLSDGIKTKFTTDDGQKLMYVISGRDGLGELAILFNSMKFARMVEQIKPELKGQKVLMKGFDKDVNRHYTIQLV